MPRKKTPSDRFALQKCPTGIQGLDEITMGGIPRGRPTLVTGAAGSGKTLIALEFLVKGATFYDEPGVFMAFEETEEELTTNVSSLGFDLDGLVKQQKLAIDYVYIERSEIEETGEYDLEGLFVRLGNAIGSIKAKRVVLDTLEVLFASLPNEAILRAELRRLFRWLKKKGVTAVVTGERGEITLTRHGLEEFVADCVIFLDHRVTDHVSTRRLRVVKYRGSSHGRNEYPFLIDKDGISILPITSLGLDSEAPLGRVSTGIPRLDAMFDKKGYYKGSSVLVSGTAGTGKSTMAAQFVESACKRGERALYLAFEESPKQIVRNMRSAGIDLEPHLSSNSLLIRSERPTHFGLEMHLLEMTKLADQFKPHVVVMDPITNLISVGTQLDAKLMLTRFIDFLKSRQITSLFTSLTSPGASLEQSEVGVSSLMDTWIVLKHIEGQGERNRGLTIVKSRGMAHSNQFREFRLTKNGLTLEDVYLGASGALTGAARAVEIAKEQASTLARTQEMERLNRQLERRRAVLESQLTVLRSEFEAEEEEIKKRMAEVEAQKQASAEQRARIAHARKADEGADR
ncbi:MAG: circadian clock protein KaiC [Syntrophorhabdales bacterium]|jgi:circadian clock protein KaiC